jgi:hypothetical protein
MADEVFYKLTANIDGVQTYSGGEAKLARVAEWLSTPEGQIWGAPHWGNRLAQYRHSPMNGDTSAAIENHIAIDMTQDIADVAITSIRVEPVSVDRWNIKLSISGVATTINQDVTL